MLDLVDRFVPAARIVVVLLMAASLGHGIATLLRAGQAEMGAAPVPFTAPERAAPPAAAAIVDAHLFGVVPARSEPEAQPLVETRLRLTLHGVIVAPQDGASAAVISEPNRQGELYTVGSRLPGNATLEAVHPDHVILSRTGRNEKLSFPDNPARAGFDERIASAASAASAGSVPDPVPGATGPRGPAPEPTAVPNRPGTLGRAPGAVARGPGSRARDPGPGGPRGFAERGAGGTPDSPVRRLQDLVERGRRGGDVGVGELIETLGAGTTDQDLAALGLEPSAEGLRVTERTPRELYARAGLRPGDEILAINGTPVRAVRSAPGNLEGLLDQGAARIEIQRGGRRLTFTMKVP